MSEITGVRLYILRAREPEKCVPFYRDGLGLEVNHVVEGRLTQFKLPDGTHLDLETRPLVPARETVDDRVKSPESIVFYCTDVAGVAARVLEHGGSTVNAPYEFNGRMLAWVADPEGHVVGLVQA